MSDRERLHNALFGNPEREHVDVKFFVSGACVSADMLCREAASMFEQMDNSSEGDESFAENFTERLVCEIWSD